MRNAAQRARQSGAVKSRARVARGASGAADARRRQGAGAVPARAPPAAASRRALADRAPQPASQPFRPARLVKLSSQLGVIVHEVQRTQHRQPRSHAATQPRSHAATQACGRHARRQMVSAERAARRRRSGSLAICGSVHCPAAHGIEPSSHKVWANVCHSVTGYR